MRAIEIPAERAAHIRRTAERLPERESRQYLGREAALYGYGGAAAVARCAGVDPRTVRSGKKEVEDGDLWEPGGRQRRPGGGRHTCARRFAEREAGDPGAERDLASAAGEVLEAHAYGDPCETGLYANLTSEGLAGAIRLAHGFEVSPRTCHRLARSLGYSLQRNRKLDQVGSRHPLREAQFLVREEAVGLARLLGQPVVSVDTKAKVRLGPFAVGGREWRRSGDPRAALDHDFPLAYSEVYPDGHPDLPEGLMGARAVASPYGVYDVGANAAHVTVGASADTSEFAAGAIRRWWEAFGRDAHPGADELLVLADGGGSNRSSGSLFKYELALAAASMGLSAVTVVHLPPGTSKYNPIERRLWGPVSVSWAGKPMTDLEAVAGHVGATATSGGLSVTCEVDYGVYLTEGQKRKARRDGSLPAPRFTPAELLDGIATVERPLSNPRLAQWTYRIELR